LTFHENIHLAFNRNSASNCGRYLKGYFLSILEQLPMRVVPLKMAMPQEKAFISKCYEPS